MSRWVGALNPDLETPVCGCRPVRTMGGNRSVEIAFWPDSAIVPGPVVSSIPPILRTELAVDPRLAPARTGLWEVALRGKGYSDDGELAPGEVKESLDPGRAGVDILPMVRLGVLSASG